MKNLEIFLVLGIAMHSAFYAMIKHEYKEAVMIAGCGAIIYLLIRGTVWLGNKFFKSDDDEPKPGSPTAPAV